MVIVDNSFSRLILLNQNDCIQDEQKSA